MKKLSCILPKGLELKQYVDLAQLLASNIAKTKVFNQTFFKNGKIVLSANRSQFDYDMSVLMRNTKMNKKLKDQWLASKDLYFARAFKMIWESTLDFAKEN